MKSLNWNILTVDYCFVFTENTLHLCFQSNEAKMVIYWQIVIIFSVLARKCTVNDQMLVLREWLDSTLMFIITLVYVSVSVVYNSSTWIAGIHCLYCSCSADGHIELYLHFQLPFYCTSIVRMKQFLNWFWCITLITIMVAAWSHSCVNTASHYCVSSYVYVGRCVNVTGDLWLWSKLSLHQVNVCFVVCM